MRGRVAAACAVLAFWLYVGDAVAADFPTIVRDLTILQNRMVSGDEEARKAVARQFERANMLVEGVEPERWLDDRYMKAAIVYLLCGGAPKPLREIYEAGFASGSLATLLDASLRYAEGQDARGKALLDFDARDFPPLVGGHIALIQGASLIGTDDARAIDLLDLARLLMPGSLVEEAALRREIALLDPVESSDKLQLLATRYAAKYSASPYAEGFWKQFEAVYLTVASGRSGQGVAGLDGILEKAPGAFRRDAYMTLARNALLAGDFDKAGQALSKAETVATDSNGRKRVALLRAAIKSLGDIDATSLDASMLAGASPQDQELARIVAGVIARIKASEGRRFDLEKADNAASEQVDSVILAGREALEQTDALLKRATAQ